MEVFAITIFMSLAFAVLFAVLCYAERSQRLRQPNEQVALLPLESAEPSAQPASLVPTLSPSAPRS
jgi:predicted secreted protein